MDIVVLIDCLVDYVIIIRTIIYDLAYNFIIQFSLAWWENGGWMES